MPIILALKTLYLGGSNVSVRRTNNIARLAVNYGSDKCVRLRDETRQDVAYTPLNQRICGVHMRTVSVPNHPGSVRFGLHHDGPPVRTPLAYQRFNTTWNALNERMRHGSQRC